MVEPNEIINGLIKEFSHYSDLPADINALEELISKTQRKQFKKGQIILSEGETYHMVGYVLKGIIRSYYLDKNGNDITKNFHMEQQFLMDEGLVNYNTSICNYEALEDSEVLMISTKVLKNMVLANAYLKEIYLLYLENGLRYKIARENGFLTQSATERYLEFKKEYKNLDDRVKQSYIATYLGITPESLSRIRRMLREEE